MKKQILTGTDSFEKVISGNYFYIDKTLFIKELLENRGEVTLVTRPRRFGKTLNMSMLKSFFEINNDNKVLFDGLKIMKHKDIIEKHLNQYPVIFITLKNVDFTTYSSSIEKIRELVSDLFKQNLYILENDNFDETDKENFFQLRDGKSTEIRLQSSLHFLTECLYTYYKKRVIVLIDEYDASIDSSVRNGYYKEMIDFMRGFLGCVFKTNEYLEFGVLTGVQRIAGESLISSFNNLKVCGIMNRWFTSCFGFTEEEVKNACELFEMGEKYDEVKKWYDGYRFGGQDMYNPWSVVRFLEENEIDNYWLNTGSMKMLQDVFYKGGNNLRNDMAALLTDAPVMMYLEDGITYPIENADPDTFWTMLLNAGYIKPCNGAKTDRFGVELVNLEIRNIFSRYAKKWFGDQRHEISKIILEFVEYLMEGDAEKVSKILNEELLNNPSCHDFKDENSYHLFIYGILLAVSDKYTVYSNPETGRGRSDCLIKPVDKEKHAIVIEFKHEKDATKDLKNEAQKGLEQIEEKVYIHNLKKEGYKRIYKYSIAFHKKTCEVAFRKQEKHPT